ncbi:hypothetical protein BH11PSE5_BH11PSE5_22150 [soil metagenome]
MRQMRWVVYAKPPFAGPEAVLAYQSRYTHRVALSNRQLISFDQNGVMLRYKDYRRDGDERHQIMTLTADEFIRRFLLHVLPRGFHRIRHYGLLASAARRDNLALARRLLAVPPKPEVPTPDAPLDTCSPCPCCGGRMVVIETFARWCQPRAPPPVASADPGTRVMTRNDKPATMALRPALWPGTRLVPAIGYPDFGPWQPHGQTRRHIPKAHQRRLRGQRRASIDASAPLDQTSPKLKSP